MAHQSHNLPWHTLSTSLTLHPHGARNTPTRITALSLTPTPAAEKQRRHFIRALVRSLAAFAASERAKHPADPFAPPVRVSTDTIAYHDLDPDNPDADPANPPIFTPTTEEKLAADLVPPHAKTPLDELLSHRRDERRARGWLEADSYADARAELVMALFATGEMVPLLRLARWRAPDAETADARSPLMDYWTYPGANPGWSNVVTAALGAYVFLNVIYVREELWVAGQRRPGRDYRDDGAFVRMLGWCTNWQDGDSWGVPHRAFFGGEHMGYMWSVEDREEVKARFDPLREEGLEALRAYLKMCWEHLVRVWVVLEEAGEEFDWEGEVEWTIRGLWDMQKP